MRHSVETLNDFNTLALKQIFWETETFFKKLKYCVLFLASFFYKIYKLIVNFGVHVAGPNLEI